MLRPVPAMIWMLQRLIFHLVTRRMGKIRAAPFNHRKPFTRYALHFLWSESGIIFPGGIFPGHEHTENVIGLWSDVDGGNFIVFFGKHKVHKTLVMFSHERAPIRDEILLLACVQPHCCELLFEE